jgi:hypothetical protein
MVEAVSNEPGNRNKDALRCRDKSEELGLRGHVDKLCRVYVGYDVPHRTQRLFTRGLLACLWVNVNGIGDASDCTVCPFIGLHTVKVNVDLNLWWPVVVWPKSAVSGVKGSNPSRANAVPMRYFCSLQDRRASHTLSRPYGVPFMHVMLL